MKILSSRYKASIGAIISACVLFVGLAVFLLAGHAFAASNTETGGRLITIHDRGTEKTVLTQADTVAGALDAAGVTIDSADAVEPDIHFKLVAKQYDINIYRARPVIVVDGATRQKIITPYQTADQIATSAGVTLYPEDTTTLSRTDNIVAEGAGLLLTIDRATPFTFTLYGKTTTARTQSVTIGDMLKEKKITLTKDDRVSPDVSTKLTDGLAVRVWREGKQTITVDEAINFSVDTVQDGDQEVGYRAVKTPGTNGTRNVTYEVSIQDGQEVGRTEIASLTTKEPVKQVEVIGAKIKTFGGSCGDWMAAAGISDTSSAGALIARESGCNPYSVNKSSGACGVGQALPCSKTGCAMGDGVCQMIWMNQYVIGRYGSWSAALGHSNSSGWY
jgi:uncharacterized protein YabE (DUF348 family)